MRTGCAMLCRLRSRFALLLTPLLWTSFAVPTAAQNVVERVIPEAALSPTPVLPDQAVTTFVDLGWWFQKDTRGRIAFGDSIFSRDNIWQATAGIEVAVTPVLTLSGGLTYTLVDRTTRAPIGEFTSNGITGYLGASVSFLDVWTFQVSAGVGRSDVEQTRLIGGQLLPSDYNSTSRFASATLFRTMLFGDLLVRPFVQYVFANTRDPAYNEGSFLFNRGLVDTVGRGEIGGELSYPILVDDILIAPVFRLGFLYDFNLPRDYTDRSAFDLSAGLNILAGDLTGGVRLSTIVGRDDFLNYGARAFVSYKF
jgi:hypothetical protein